LYEKIPSGNPAEQANLEPTTHKSVESSLKFFSKGCPGWGANPGPLDLIYFLIFTTLLLSHSGSPRQFEV
jgi:hypothetical protein